MKKVNGLSVCVFIVSLLVMAMFANAGVYDYSGAGALGVWSGDNNGHYMWEKVESHTGGGSQLTRMLGHDKMFWSGCPIFNTTWGYADPDPDNYYYYLPEGQHEVVGAMWTAPEGEVITKIEFAYSGTFGGGGHEGHSFPQFSIYAGATSPNTLSYMSNLEYSSWTLVPFELTFDVAEGIKSIQVNVWELFAGDRMDDCLGAAFENIKVTTAIPEPTTMTLLAISLFSFISRRKV